MSKTNKVIIISFILSSLVVLYYGGLFRSSEPQEQQSTWKPELLPDLQFTKIDGTTMKLSDYKGKVMLLNFWASWCAPCIKEFPSMVKLVDKNKGNLVLIAISHDSSMKDIQKFLGKYSGKLAKKNNENIIIAWDKDQSIARDTFSVVKIPETIIVDKNMKMVSKIVGEIDWYGSEMRNDIDKLINE